MAPIESLDPAEIEEIRNEMTRDQHPVDCWFCCGLIANGMDVLIVPYYPDYINEPGVVQIKFPGGTGGGKNNTPKQTLMYEIRQEVFQGNGRVASWRPLFKKPEPCKRHEGGYHTKYGVLVEIEGALRTEDLYEGRHVTESGRETNEKLGPPRFVSAEELTERLFRGHKPFLLTLARYKLRENSLWWNVAHELASVQRITY